MKRQVVVGGSGYYNQDGAGDGPNLDTSMCFGNTGMSCNAGSFNLSDIFGGSGDSTTNVRVPDYITPLDTSAPVSLPTTIEDDAAKAYTLTADELKSLFTQGYAQPSNNAENDAGGGGKSAVAGSAKDAAALAALFKPAAAAAAPAGAKVAQNAAPVAATAAPAAPATPWGTIALVAGGGLLMCVLIIVVANRA